MEKSSSTSQSFCCFEAIYLTAPYKVYIFAQTLGGIVGAAVVYGNYFHAIDLFEGHGVRTLKTAGLFATYSVSV